MPLATGAPPSAGAKLLRAPSHLGRLWQDRRGVALVEFAYVLPIFFVLGFFGLELANFAIAHLRINQLAISVADNLSRAKQASATGAPRLREFDIQDAFIAARRQSAGLRLQERGRIVVSSLEVNGDGGQWVHWQRCAGDKDYRPRFGEEGDGLTGTGFAGMGPPGRRVIADDDSAIMFVEVAYDYETLFGEIIGADMEIRKTAAMYVRDDRDLSQIYNPAPAVPVAGC